MIIAGESRWGLLVPLILRTAVQAATRFKDMQTKSAATNAVGGRPQRGKNPTHVVCHLNVLLEHSAPLVTQACRVLHVAAALRARSAWRVLLRVHHACRANIPAAHLSAPRVQMARILIETEPLFAPFARLQVLCCDKAD
jgi:hypothetical protein